MLTVENIPWWLKPFYLVFFYFLAGLCVFSYWMVRSTIRIQLHGNEKADACPNAIYAIWHENWIAYFVCFPKLKNHVWMSHAAWYMKHVNLVGLSSGVERFVYGSTGNAGREAADQLVIALKNGASTTFSPDGPYGPAKVLKKGILHIAMQSGVPIIPIHFQVPHAIRVPFTWEGKRYPRPFTTVDITFGEPLFVTEATFKENAVWLSASL